MDEQTAGSAFERRDRRHDGKFVVGVRTTGIYCRPSCPARRPKRKNVRFYASEAEAKEQGLRPCLRCLPDAVARDAVAVRRVRSLLEEAGGPLPLAVLAEATGYSPTHLQRIF